MTIAVMVPGGRSGTWIEFEVTSQVTGNGPISFAVVGQSTDGIDLSAWEGAPAFQPQLVIIGAPPAAPVATPTVEPAREPTLEPTAPPGLMGKVVTSGGVGPRCRTGPSVDSDVIVVLAAGEAVTVRGPQEGDWLPVVCAGQDGYAAAAWIAVAPTVADPGQQPTPRPTPVGVTPGEGAAPTKQVHGLQPAQYLLMSRHRAVRMSPTPPPAPP